MLHVIVSQLDMSLVIFLHKHSMTTLVHPLFPLTYRSIICVSTYEVHFFNATNFPGNLKYVCQFQTQKRSPHLTSSASESAIYFPLFVNRGGGVKTSCICCCLSRLEFESTSVRASVITVLVHVVSLCIPHPFSCLC